MTLDTAYDSAAANAWTGNAIEADAIARGFSRHVSIEADCSTLEGFIDPGADLDGVFVMIDDTTGETLLVNGWLVAEIEDL